MNSAQTELKQTLVLRGMSRVSEKYIWPMAMFLCCMFLLGSYGWLGNVLIPNYEYKTIADLRVTLAVWGLAIVVCYFIVFVILFACRSKIELDSFGLFRKANMPTGFGFNYFVRDWSFAWSDIEKVGWVSVKNGMTLGFASLLMFTMKDGGAKSIAPHNWVNINSKAGNDQAQDFWFNLKLIFNNQASKDRVNECLEESALALVVKSARQDLDLSLDNSVAQNKPQAKNSLLEIFVATTLICSIIYFWVEVFFTLREFYAGSTPYFVFIVIAFIAIYLCSEVFKFFQPLSINNWVYSLFFGLAIAFLSYPLGLRINQISGALESYTYKLDDEFIWQVVTNDSKELGDQLPSLDIYLSSSDWWTKFQPGDEYVFQLRKGFLGFWQINMDEVYKAQKELAR